MERSKDLIPGLDAACRQDHQLHATIRHQGAAFREAEPLETIQRPTSHSTRHYPRHRQATASAFHRWHPACAVPGRHSVSTRTARSVSSRCPRVLMKNSKSRIQARVARAFLSAAAVLMCGERSADCVMRFNSAEYSVYSIVELIKLSLVSFFLRTMRSLNKHTALVTGGTGGIGFHTAVGLARAGARVFVTGRNEPRGRQAIREMRRLAGHDAIDLLIADTSSVRANVWLAEEISRRVLHLDILVNNAGRVILSRTETPEGFEASLALNFIGPFALTTHLLPLLSRAPAARVVNVVSSAFEMWTRDPFEDLEHRRDVHVAIEAHARAKLLNFLLPSRWREGSRDPA